MAVFAVRSTEAAVGNIRGPVVELVARSSGKHRRAPVADRDRFDCGTYHPTALGNHDTAQIEDSVRSSFLSGSIQEDVSFGSVGVPGKRSTSD